MAPEQLQQKLYFLLDKRAIFKHKAPTLQMAAVAQLVEPSVVVRVVVGSNPIGRPIFYRDVKSKSYICPYGLYKRVILVHIFQP